MHCQESALWDVAVTEPDRTTRRFEIERQVFPHCMQVRHTYSNKRKSYGMSKLLHESPIKLPGETIDSSSTEKYPEKNHIVEKWLQKNENEMSKQANTRTPFADVYVNIPSNVRSNANLAVSTRKLRLGINLNMKENSSINTEQQVHSNSFVPYKKSRIRQFEDNIYQINDNKKTDFHTKKASTMDEILSSKEFSSHDDEPIVIENSQEILIDKDYLACLDVLKSEEAQRNINLDVMDVEVIEKLNHALKTLKNDITETMMKENMPLYIVNKNARLFLSPQALLTTLTAEHSTSSLNISKTRNRVLNRKDGKVCLKFKMKKAIEDKNSKQPVNTASENQLVELSSLSSIHLKNPIVNKSKVSISTDFANKGRSEGVMSETSNVFQNLQQRDVFGSKLQEEMISCEKQLYGDILRLNDNSANIVVDNECEHSDDLFTPVDTVHTDAPVIFEESSNYNAYEVSGNHVVEVQVHASHISPETTPEHSIIEGSPQNIRSSPRLSNSLSLACRRISFGYQQPPLTCNQQGFDNIEVTSLHSSGNISNNSSDKENYHPNTIRKIVDKCEKDKKHKENAAEMRLPFIVLSETDMFEKVCVSCSWLGSADMSIVKLLCKQQGWSFTPHYKPNVTHLVVPVDVENKAPRSISYVCALAAGRWIVSVQWANLCLTQECHLEEKPFEVTDECGALSPRLSRTSTRGLFTGLTFCLLPPFNSIQRDILTEVVVSAGGRAAGPGDTPEQRGLHIALCQPAEETDVDTYTDGEVGTRRVLLHYKWVVECLGRYDLISPEPFLLHPTDVDQINKVRMITNQEPFNESS